MTQFIVLESIRKKDASWPIISTVVRSQRRSVSSEISSLWTLRPRPPLPPPSPLGKGSNDHLFVLRELSRLARAAPLRCKDVPGEAQSLDDRSSFPKGKYSPSESESANNICNTSSRYNFLLAIWRFSLTNLTIHS